MEHSDDIVESGDLMDVRKTKQVESEVEEDYEGDRKMRDEVID